MNDHDVFVRELTQKFGTPEGLARKVLDSNTGKQGLFDKITLGACMRHPEVFIYSGLSGAGIGLVIALVFSYVFGTLVGSRRKRAVK